MNSINAVTSTPMEAYAAYVALDWADKKHVWALQKAGSSNRQQSDLDARPEQVEKWIVDLLARFPGELIAVALEQSRGPLMSQLSRFERLVLYPVHPGTVSRMRSALYPSSSKSDPKDAHLILDILLYHRDKLRPLHADTEETRKLKFLVEDRRGLVDTRTGLTNQLRARLKVFFPQVLGWFGNLAAPLVLDFLRRWPTLPAAQKARPDTLRKFFSRHNCRKEELIQLRLEEIPKAVVVTQDPAIIDPAMAMVRALVDLIATLQTHVAELDRLIAATAAVHPELPLIKSFPATGKAMAPRLVATMGTQRDRFETACDLQTCTGIAPVTIESGQSRRVSFRYACSTFDRQTFHEWAGHTISESVWAKAYYDQLIAKGMGHHAAVRALAFKWQRILFHCWKTGELYDEQKYIAALHRRGSPLVKLIPAA